MSETVHYKGKLLPTNKTVIEFIGDVEIPDYYDDEQEYFDDKFYYQAVVIDGKVFAVEKNDIDEDRDIMISTKNDDGTIDFELRYYNGGCSFNEAIEEAVK